MSQINPFLLCRACGLLALFLVCLAAVPAYAWECGAEPLILPNEKINEAAAAEPWGPDGAYAIAVPADRGGYELYYQVSVNEYCPVLTTPPALQIRILDACPDAASEGERELPCIEAVHVPWRGQSNTRSGPYGGDYSGTFVTYAPDARGKYTVELRASRLEFAGPDLDKLPEQGKLFAGRLLVRDFEDTAWRKDFPVRQPMNRLPFPKSGRWDKAAAVAESEKPRQGPLPAGAIEADQIRGIWNDASYAVYLVLEGAGKRDMRKFLSEEMGVEDYFLRLLYKGNPRFDTPEMLGVSPCIVKVKADSKLWNWYMREGAWNGEGVIVLGPTNSDAMVSHLQKITECVMPDKKRAFVRFYDPYPMQFMSGALAGHMNFKGPMTNLLYPSQFGGYFYRFWDDAQQNEKIQTSAMAPPIVELTAEDMAAVNTTWSQGPIRQLTEWLTWDEPAALEKKPQLPSLVLDICRQYDLSRVEVTGNANDRASTERTTAPRDLAHMLSRYGQLPKEAIAILRDASLERKERAAKIAALTGE